MGLSAAESSQLNSGIGGSQSGPSFTGERIDVASCIPCVPPAITAAGKAVTATAGIVGGLWLGSKANIIYNESARNLGLPADLIGTQDAGARQQGNRHNSGPLDPSNGGTGNSQQDFDRLTGGVSGPAPEGSSYPPGTLIGENGIVFRPGEKDTGSRIDIPANGTKPHETLHY